MIWRRSSSCDSGSCVVVAIGDDDVHVRDSKEERGPVLRFDLDEWREFVRAVKAGRFDVGGE